MCHICRKQRAFSNLSPHFFHFFFPKICTELFFFNVNVRLTKLKLRTPQCTGDSGSNLLILDGSFVFILISSAVSYSWVFCVFPQKLT